MNSMNNNVVLATIEEWREMEPATRSMSFRRLIGGKIGKEKNLEKKRRQRQRSSVNVIDTIVRHFVYVT